MSIPYGREYDEDGFPLDEHPDNGKQPMDVHTGQAYVAYRLAATHADRLMHVRNLGWLWWDGRRWLRDGGLAAAIRCTLAVLRDMAAEAVDKPDSKKRLAEVARCSSHAGVTGVLGIACALEAFDTGADELDADPYLLNVENGTLDLRTGSLSVHEPRDRITKVCRAAYEPDSAPGDWARTLAQILPDPTVREFLQRYIGAALLGEVRDHKLAVWIGGGRNGKGVTYGALLYALGDYAIVADADLLTPRDGAHTTTQLDLMGVRLAIVSETQRGRQLNEALMKRLTGGDRIRGRRMHRDTIEFAPSHTLAMVTNHLPKVEGNDPATWARLLAVPFTESFLGREDDTLPGRLELAAAEVLTWAVRGWQDYTEQGLAPPPAVLAETSAYRQSSDAIGRFIDERCHRSQKFKFGHVYDSYTQWCRGEQITPVEKTEFKADLERRGFKVERGTGNQYFVHELCLLAPDSGSDDR